MRGRPGSGLAVAVGIVLGGCIDVDGPWAIDEVPQGPEPWMTFDPGVVTFPRTPGLDAHLRFQAGAVDRLALVARDDATADDVGYEPRLSAEDRARVAEQIEDLRESLDRRDVLAVRLALTGLTQHLVASAEPPVWNETVREAERDAAVRAMAEVWALIEAEGPTEGSAAARTALARPARYLALEEAEFRRNGPEAAADLMRLARVRPPSYRGLIDAAPAHQALPAEACARAMLETVESAFRSATWTWDDPVGAPLGIALGEELPTARFAAEVGNWNAVRSYSITAAWGRTAWSAQHSSRAVTPESFAREWSAMANATQTLGLAGLYVEFADWHVAAHEEATGVRDGDEWAGSVAALAPSFFAAVAQTTARMGEGVACAQPLDEYLRALPAPPARRGQIMME